MLKIAVLISGTGTNLADLLVRIKQHELPIRVVAIGADRECEGLALAEEHQLPKFLVDFESFETRTNWSSALEQKLAAFPQDLLVLSGFMRLLPAEFIENYQVPIINTHPSLLPNFPGANAVRDALAAGAESTGASVILVDEGVDTGQILAQEPIEILPSDTEETLHSRIKLVERELLAKVILSFINPAESPSN